MLIYQDVCVNNMSVFFVTTFEWFRYANVLNNRVILQMFSSRGQNIFKVACQLNIFLSFACLDTAGNSAIKSAQLGRLLAMHKII